MRDWYTGFRAAFRAVGLKHRINRGWSTSAYDLRRRSLEAVLDRGKDGPPRAVLWCRSLTLGICRPCDPLSGSASACQTHFGHVSVW